MTRRAKKPGELPWLTYDKDRHGNPRTYVRRYGRRVRIKTSPSDPAAFTAEYNTALASLKPRPKDVAERPAPPIGIVDGTLEWLAKRYMDSDAYGAYAESTKRSRALILNHIVAQPMPDAAAGHLGRCPLDQFDASHVRYLRDLRKGKSRAGVNNWRKVLSSMCSWAIDEGLMNHNPCRDVKKIKYVKQPIHTWTEDELKRYIARWPIGTREFLAFCLLLFTGMRKSDMVRFGPDWVANDVIVYKPQKTTNSTGKVLYIPMLPHLKAAIESTPVRAGNTFLTTEYGAPFTVNGFGNWFRERCNKAGLPHCSAHGLRKSGAMFVAENAGTGPQLMAIFGWSNLQQANTYIEMANQKKLAAQAMHLIGIPGIVDGAPLLPFKE